MIFAVVFIFITLKVSKTSCTVMVS